MLMHDLQKFEAGANPNEYIMLPAGAQPRFHMSVMPPSALLLPTHLNKHYKSCRLHQYHTQCHCQLCT